LAILIQSGDDDYIAQLWIQVRAFVVKKAILFFGKLGGRCGVEVDDLIQSGYFAVEKAAKYYKADSGWKYLTYLGHTLKNVFREAAGLRTSKRDPLNNCMSLDEVIGEDSEATRLDMLADPDGEAPYNIILDDQLLIYLQNALDEAISKLIHDRAKVIRDRYFLGKSQKQIADEMGVTSSYVCFLEQEGLHRLRRDRNIQAFYDGILSEEAYHGTGYTAFKETQASSVERAFEHVYLAKARAMSRKSVIY
jgi:RNA polymerase sporulation-specific sigma factor